MLALTPVELRDGIYFKRDDYFEVAGAFGGKARTCWVLAQGAQGLVTAGSRHSPQVNIVSHIADLLNINCRVHVPQGELTPELIDSVNHGAQLVQHFPGYNSVICKRAADDAKNLNWTYIPFGMDCWEAVKQTAAQVDNIPKQVKRIVVPVGSSMTFCGILNGLAERGINIPVLGVVVGANPRLRLLKYADKTKANYELVHSTIPYHKYPDKTEICGVNLDPVYESKCIEFLQPGDLMWVVGIRTTEKKS